MSIRYFAPGVPGGEVSPGAGTTGFTSRAIPFANASGQLTASSAGAVFDTTNNALGLWSTATDAARAWIDPTVVPGWTGIWLQQGTSRTGANYTLISDGSSAYVSAPTLVGLQGGGVVGVKVTGGAVTIGSSADTVRLSLPSTLNVSTAVGTSGGAAAPPANPTVYIKILAPNAAGTLTTLYLPAYNSTG